MTLSEYGINGGINCIEEIEKHKNRKFSYSSLGTMDSVYHLLDEDSNGRVKFLGSRNQIIHIKRKRKVLVLGDTLDNDKKLLQSLSVNNMLLSSIKLDFLNNSICEIKNDYVYKLEDVFNHDNYSSRKKVKTKLIKPFKWLKSHNIIIQSHCNSVEEVKKLHQSWVDKKMSLDSTSSLYFPKNQYFYIFTRTIENTGVDYIPLFFYDEEELIGMRISSREGDYAFGLANIINFWDYSQLSNYIYTYLLDYFYRCDVKYYNAGGTGGHPGLSDYKMQYPYFIRPFYIYKRDKTPIPVRTLDQWV